MLKTNATASDETNGTNKLGAQRNKRCLKRATFGLRKWRLFVFNSPSSL